MNNWLRMLCCTVVLLIGADLSAQVTQFRAELGEGYVSLAGVQGTGSTAAGSAEFTLTQVPGNPSANSLTYEIQFENVDLNGTQTASIFDDITALHIHDVTRCAPMFPQCLEGSDTAGTIHLLNIFGLPRNDDADVVVDPLAGTISGSWDVGDTSASGTPVPTLSIADPAVINLLLNEQAALFVHTNEIPTAAAGGLLTVVPEPSSHLLVLLAGLPFVLRFRRIRALQFARR